MQKNNPKKQPSIPKTAVDARHTGHKGVTPTKKRLASFRPLV